MKVRIIAQAVVGFLLSVFVVMVFAPRTGSFWDPTFFGIPYQIAITLVPLFSGGCAALSGLLVLRNPNNRQRSPLRLGVGIGFLAFTFYFVFHVFSYAIFNGIVEAAYFAGALAIFGAVVFLPVFFVLSTTTEYIVRRYEAP